jgi:hypothetical protein
MNAYPEDVMKAARLRASAKYPDFARHIQDGRYDQTPIIAIEAGIFVELRAAILAERERAAKVAETTSPKTHDAGLHGEELAAAIRRGDAS